MTPAAAFVASVNSVRPVVASAPKGSSNSERGLLLVVAAASLWGTVTPTTRALYELAETNALSIGFLRLALGASALLVACRAAVGAGAFRVAGRDLAAMGLIGLAMALYQVTLFSAIPRVGVQVAVLVALCSAPVAVGLLSAALLRERPESRTLVSMAAALAGTALLVGARPAESDTGALLEGALLALAAGLSYALVVLAGRALAGRYHPLQPTAIGFGLGAALLLPFAAPGLVLAYPPLGWLLLLHLGFVTTALGYGLFLAGLRRTPATDASIATLLEPLIAAMLAWVLFGERLSPTGLVGAALLLGAMGVLYRRT